MAYVRVFLLIAFMTATACLAGNTENTWYGEYAYFASGGETAGGSQVMMHITLKIDKQGNEATCQLNADGYQTYDRILCTAAMDKNRLTLRFKSYPDGSTVNPIGIEGYKVGETLFSLKRTDAKNDKKQARYLTYWGTYSPFWNERKNVKDYFEKIK